MHKTRLNKKSDTDRRRCRRQRDQSRVYLMTAHAEWVQTKKERGCRNDEDFAHLLLDSLAKSLREKKWVDLHDHLAGATEHHYVVLKFHATYKRWSTLKTEMGIESRMSDEILANILLNYWCKGHEHDRNTTTITLSKTGSKYIPGDFDLSKEGILNNSTMTQEKYVASIPPKPDKLLNEIEIPTESKSWDNLAACIDPNTNSVKLFLANRLICQISCPDDLDMTHDLVRDCLKVADMEEYVFSKIVGLHEEIGKVPPLSIEDVPITFVDACAINGVSNEQVEETIKSEEQLLESDEHIVTYDNGNEEHLSQNYGVKNALCEESEDSNNDVEDIESGIEYSLKWQPAEDENPLFDKDDTRDEDWQPESESDSEFEEDSMSNRDDTKYEDNIKDSDWLPDTECKKSTTKKRKANEASTDKKGRAKKLTRPNIKGSEIKDTADDVLVRSIGKKKKVKCDLCQRKFQSDSILSKHKLVTHDKTHMECHVCKDIFTTKYELQEHKKIHNATLCPYCGIQLMARGVRHHIERMHPHKENLVTCTHPGCGKKMAKHVLHSHLKFHVKDRICSYCGWAFSYKKTLANHIKQVHDNERNCPCLWENCGKVFKTNYALKCHTRIHTGYKPYQCQLCAYSGNQKAALNWHMKKHYSKNTNDTC